MNKSFICQTIMLYDINVNVYYFKAMIRQLDSQQRLGQEHIVKLLDKKIKVHLQYNSPFKKDRAKLKSFHLSHFTDHSKFDMIRSKKIKHLSPPLCFTKYQKYKHSPYFYINNIQESTSILAQYQKLHTKLLNNETETPKIKVYSNSKELKMKKENQINISVNLKQPNSSKAKVPVRKIKLYSPNKKDKQNIPKSSVVVKLHQQKPIKGTPQRKYKLQVTSSSKSRNKYDSRLSNKQVSAQASNLQSIEVSRFKKLKLTEGSPSAHMNSLHSFYLNQK